MIKSIINRWVGHAACIGELRNTCKSVVATPEIKSPLELYGQK
jgi:hypothetical protein